MLKDIVEVERENEHLRKIIDGQISAEHNLRLEVENLTKQVVHHKRVRKAITRQLKDVEKSRKYEFGLYLERFQVVQDVILSMRAEIKKITEEYKNTNVSTWKFWK